jgi:glutathione S-transferase
MKLYYSPLACSLADHIALREAKMTFDIERVDLQTFRTASGEDFGRINPKKYVPALILDNGTLITENVALLDWIASETQALQIPGPLGRTRVLEALTYITTEIHRAYKPMWHAGSAADRAKARETVLRLLQPLSDGLEGDYLFGAQPSVADFYLFVMLLWADRFALDLPLPLLGLRERMKARPAVKAAMAAEGLD